MEHTYTCREARLIALATEAPAAPEKQSDVPANTSDASNVKERVEALLERIEDAIPTQLDKQGWETYLKEAKKLLEKSNPSTAKAIDDTLKHSNIEAYLQNKISVKETSETVTYKNAEGTDDPQKYQRFAVELPAGQPFQWSLLEGVMNSPDFSYDARYQNPSTAPREAWSLTPRMNSDGKQELFIDLKPGSKVQIVCAGVTKILSAPAQAKNKNGSEAKDDKKFNSPVIGKKEKEKEKEETRPDAPDDAKKISVKETSETVTYKNAEGTDDPQKYQRFAVELPAGQPFQWSLLEGVMNSPDFSYDTRYPDPSAAPREAWSLTPRMNSDGKQELFIDLKPGSKVQIVCAGVTKILSAPAQAKNKNGSEAKDDKKFNSPVIEKKEKEKEETRPDAPDDAFNTTMDGTLKNFNDDKATPHASPPSAPAPQPAAATKPAVAPPAAVPEATPPTAPQPAAKSTRRPSPIIKLLSRIRSNKENSNQL